MLNPGRYARGENRGKPCADDCGTSFPFTEYPSKTNPNFKSTVGTGTDNEGAVANGQQMKGAFRDVGYADAKKNDTA